jgi:predicted nucleic acid-binding protein
MILVDTSVWIDFFAGRKLPHVQKLQQLVLDNTDLALCGIILTEVLQGLSDDADYRRVKQGFEPLIRLPMQASVFISAADLYRGLRKEGITIRKSNDCMIAAAAMEYGCELLHNDRDFERIAEACSLETL